MADPNTYTSGSGALSLDQSMREYRAALDHTANRLAMAERDKALVITQAQNAMDEADKNFKTHIEYIWGQLQQEKKNAQQARADLQEYIIKAKEENKVRARTEKELVALQTQRASRQELISSLERTAMADKDEIQALKDALTSERRKVGSQSGAGDAAIGQTAMRQAPGVSHGKAASPAVANPGNKSSRKDHQPQNETASAEELVQPRGTKRPASDHIVEPASASQAKKRVKTSAPAVTTQSVSSNEGCSVSNQPRPSSGQPSGQPIEQAYASSSSAANASRTAKLSVMNFLAKPKKDSMWYELCKVELPPFDHNGYTFEMGDIVIMNDFLGHSNGLTPSDNSNPWQKKLIGVLCDYSMHGLCPKHGEPTCLRSKFGEGTGAEVRSVAVSWIMSKSHIEDLIAGRAKVHEPPHPDESFRIPFLRKRFLHESIPNNQRFLTSIGLEWVGINDLIGLVGPTDIGTGTSSRRPIIINWSDPILTSIQHPVGRRLRERRATLIPLSHLNLKPEREFPSGWIYE
ncbi:unnamed protein product [Peniophora sp. CBMAI 1063]|nr:unnamed protein product [Peniophora sp. CBMAI 1063]